MSLQTLFLCPYFDIFMSVIFFYFYFIIIIFFFGVNQSFSTGLIFVFYVLHVISQTQINQSTTYVTLLKKRLQHRSLPVHFEEFLRKSILQNICTFAKGWFCFYVETSCLPFFDLHNCSSQGKETEKNFFLETVAMKGLVNLKYISVNQLFQALLHREFLQMG